MYCLLGSSCMRTLTAVRHFSALSLQKNSTPPLHYSSTGSTSSIACVMSKDVLLDHVRRALPFFTGVTRPGERITPLTLELCC